MCQHTPAKDDPMPLIYNRDLFHRWHKLAVTTKEAMQLGETFYATTGEHFTLMAFTTEADYLSRLGLDAPGDPGDPRHDIAISTTGRFYRLSDFNVGESYTPWLLFREEAVCRACQISLPVTIDSGPSMW